MAINAPPAQRSRCLLDLKRHIGKDNPKYTQDLQPEGVLKHRNQTCRVIANIADSELPVEFARPKLALNVYITRPFGIRNERLHDRFNAFMSLRAVC